MDIAQYQDIAAQYNAAWKVVHELRTMVQHADAYLAAYGVEWEGDHLHLRANPRTHVNMPAWPTADQIVQAISDIKQHGEAVVMAYNELEMTDRYLIQKPDLR